MKIKNKMVNRYPKKYPLHHAVKQGKMSDIIRLLKHKGCDPYLGDNQYRVALYYAITTKKLMVRQRRLIIQLLCRYMSHQKLQHNIVILPVTKCEPISLRLIIDTLGTQLRFLPCMPQTMYNLVQKQKYEHINVILESFPLTYEEYWQLMVCGLVIKHTEYCKLLIDNFAKLNLEEKGVNYRFQFNQTFLHIACLEGTYDIIKYLLEQHKANPNILSTLSTFPMGYALYRDDPSLIDLLIQYNAKVYNLPSYLGHIFTLNHTPLILHIFNDSERTIEELLLCYAASSLRKQHDILEIMRKRLRPLLELGLGVLSKDIIMCNIVPFLV